jgi:RimJ/RimL family protein N-acetyltransferase
VFVHGLPKAAADGEQLTFVIADAQTDDLLGTIAVLRPSWEDARAEIGYWLAPWGRGRGAATTATRLLAHWALDALPIQRIELRIDADNAGSQAVAKRSGFTREGTLRSFEERKGSRVDVTVWSLLATDPR